MIKTALRSAPIAAILLATTARGQVMEATATSLQVKHGVQIAAPPDKVWKGIVAVGSWWDSEHTYSGDAKNMKLDARPGGCWCEALPGGGGVEHMTVAYVAPGKRLVMRGALGPFQTSGVAGAMTWELAPKGNGTELVVVYNVGGYMPGGLAAIAQGVDGVIHQQVERLRTFVETGKAPRPSNTGEKPPSAASK